MTSCHWVSNLGALAAGGTRGGERGGEFFVEGEEVFHARAVGGEGFAAVAAIHGPVERGVGGGEGGRHGERVVKVGEGGGGEGGAGVEHPLGGGLHGAALRWGGGLFDGAGFALGRGLWVAKGFVWLRGHSCWGKDVRWPFTEDICAVGIGTKEF